MQRILIISFFTCSFIIIYITLYNLTRTSRKGWLFGSLPDIRSKSVLKSCEYLRSSKGKPVRVNMTVPTWSEVEEQCNFVLPGGQYKPDSCVAASNIALIVPYRDRETQLRTFLRHIHPFLRNQFVNYRIFVVELAKHITFNRGALFNAGFIEANKLSSFGCFVLHDVDLLPEDNRNSYACASMPLHLSAAIDKFDYGLPYEDYFGGVVAITGSQFQTINGCSNLYNGWGGEDDDLYYRVLHKHMTVLRQPLYQAKYKMIRHDRDQPENEHILDLLNSTQSRMLSDGLNSIHYKVLRTEFRPLYTWILVSINHTHLEYQSQCGKH